MTAVELLRALHASGTGMMKIHAARAAARVAGKVLSRLGGPELLMMMGRAWPEGTVAKAFRLTQGLPADAPKTEASSGPSDWEAWAREDAPDEEYGKAFRDRPLDVEEEEPSRIMVPVQVPGDDGPPGIHETPDDTRPTRPGMSRDAAATKPTRGRPPKARPLAAAAAEAPV